MNKILYIIIISLLLFGCALKKTSQESKKVEPLSFNEILDSLNNHSLDYKTLKNKASATLFFKNEKNTVKINFRIQKDSLIWVNLSKSGVQLLTTLLSKDSIKFLKKINKKVYFFGDYKELEKLINSSLDYYLIEDFINAKAIMLNKQAKYYASINNGCYLLSSIKPKKIDKVLTFHKSIDDEIIYRYWINPDIFKCTKVEINFLEKNRTLLTKYMNWRKFDQGLFPMESEIVLINNSDTASVRLEYQPNFKFNSQLTFPFKISQNYSKIKLPINE
ncbi:MAG: hypothetical protein CL853_08475 [Crocinitomicaceae bacterium]|nr:hypothetical protein [Crocinitomicaceae bacterium]